MKKFFLFAAAMLAAVSVNARVITLDLSTATEMAYTGCSAEFAVADGALNVNYTAGGWEWAGVEIALDNLAEVNNISFEYKGDGTSVVIYVYLRDDQGARWTKGNYWPNLASTSFVEISEFMPDELLWDAAEYAFGDHPFTSIGFIANPGDPTTGSFALKNVKITVPGEDTGIEDVNASVKAVKMVRNGQLIIIRDGKTFNAIGAEMK
ncbi:MAG: hypothetical protein J5761_05440 [Paludibacteraceae bacterium]|nr:hypothetical protein [Paludibacteraceae bacterium]